MLNVGSNAHFTLKIPYFPHQIGKNYKDIISNIAKNMGETILKVLSVDC